MMKFNLKSEKPTAHITPCLIVPCVETAKPENCAKELDAKLNGVVASAYKEKTILKDN